jgi:hypothetical protein
MWFNPFLAQVDVMCGTETGFGASCQVVAGVTNRETTALDANGQAFGPPQDSYWPRSMLAMLVTAAVLIILSVQLVSPTRRWRLRRSKRGVAAAEAAGPSWGDPAVAPAQAGPAPDPTDPPATSDPADPPQPPQPTGATS